MIGPAAPRDPEKRRDFFYIMKDKDIFGTRTEEGRGIQYLYQDNERLVDSARMTGGITDESLLDLLRSVHGLKKLVHSIGVSVETDDPKEPILFIFQMYGRRDMYGGGTQLKLNLRADGAQQAVVLSDAVWSADDFIPGQIQIIMEKPEQIGKLSVRFYLNDGYHAPEVHEEDQIDADSDAYRNMIADSFVSPGDASRLKRVLRKAAKGEDVTIAYIGGSITQGAGAAPVHTGCYAFRSCRLFQNKFGGGGRVRLIKAGVGGTSSELGVIRFERDVLRDGTEEPDLIVIEFAVNDEGDETKGDCYESLVRKAAGLPNRPAVVLLFSVFANDENLQERMIPVGRHYNLPMVSIKNAVTGQFYKKSTAKRVMTKNQFFYDSYHPSNAGHAIMADCLMYLWEQAGMADPVPEKDRTTQLLKSAGTLMGSTFEHVRLLDKKDSFRMAKIMPGGFTGTDRILQKAEMDDSLEPVPEFPYNWYYDGTDTAKAYFEMEISCRALILVFKDSGETDAARAHIYVDHAYVRTADPYKNGWLHCNPMIILNEQAGGVHFVRIEIDQADREKKCTILGFGYVE